MQDSSTFALLEKQTLDRIIEQCGGILQEFRLKSKTLIAWIVIGIIAILIGTAGLGLIAFVFYEAHQSDKPENKLTFQQRLKIGSVLLLMIGLIYFGIDRIKASRKLLGSRILITREAFLLVQKESTKVFRWQDLTKFQQTKVKGTNEKYPGYPAMNRDMKCSIVRIDGEQFDYDYDTIESHQAFTRLLYDALKDTEIPWEFMENG
jgi:hypothetical protein